MINDKYKYYWYDNKTNNFLSKEESKKIIEEKIKISENLIKKVLNAYKDFEYSLAKAKKHKNDNNLNYLLNVDETISCICIEFKEIIKEYEKNDN